MTANEEPAVRLANGLPFSRCPHCHGQSFACCPHDRQLLFVCDGCGDTWRYVLGYLVPSSVRPLNG